MGPRYRPKRGKGPAPSLTHQMGKAYSYAKRKSPTAALHFWSSGISDRIRKPIPHRKGIMARRTGSAPTAFECAAMMIVACRAVPPHSSHRSGPCPSSTPSTAKGEKETAVADQQPRVIQQAVALAISSGRRERRFGMRKNCSADHRKKGTELGLSRTR